MYISETGSASIIRVVVINDMIACSFIPLVSSESMVFLSEFRPVEESVITQPVMLNLAVIATSLLFFYGTASLVYVDSWVLEST